MTWSPLRTPTDFVILGGKISPGIAELQGFKRVFRWDERRGYGLSGAHSVYRGMGLAQGRLVLRLYTEQDWEDWEDWRSILRPPEQRRASPGATRAQADARGQLERAERSLSVANNLAQQNPEITTDPAWQRERARATSDYTAAINAVTAARSRQSPVHGPRPRALEIQHPLMAQLDVKAVTVTEVSQPEQTDDGEWTVTIGLLEYRRPQFNLATPDGAADRPSRDPVDRVLDANSRIIERLARGEDVPWGEEIRNLDMLNLPGL